MSSLILSTATRYLLPLLLLFSVFLLLRGHNDPGGGFVGGLVAAAALALYGLTFGAEEARRLIKIDPRRFISVGLLLAVSSGLVAPLFQGRPFMSGVWGAVELPALGKPGTPLLFDAGVYLVVVGVVLTILFALSEDSS